MTGPDAAIASLDTRLLIGGELTEGDGGPLSVENPATEAYGDAGGQD